MSDQFQLLSGEKLVMETRKNKRFEFSLVKFVYLFCLVYILLERLPSLPPKQILKLIVNTLCGSSARVCGEMSLW